MPFLRLPHSLLQPTCDCQTVTDNYESRHDIVLAKMQANFYHMKSLVLTLACKSKTSIQHRGFIQPSLLRRGGYSISAGGFYFGNFALIGVLKPKEVAVVTEGLNLYPSNIALQSFIQKEIIL